MSDLIKLWPWVNLKISCKNQKGLCQKYICHIFPHNQREGLDATMSIHMLYV
ncbi:hypothetical protein A359_07210 [secondary endosymbiont of Ctenarytaina eucalypti]|uniref:Uncharacterized protein n=1 Tax=secondary endosymbiont of Ctenarytaina eucalypti TaxID=1199245 RepID=J3TXU2_9ENTR|nr:hypothetical protein A359_07210 [secondary endosymbiont of Ctenarytaina eucalypti]